ncbi:MAG: peptidylprolyl isomerase [Candidatus Bruticola sp.]
MSIFPGGQERMKPGLSETYARFMDRSTLIIAVLTAALAAESYFLFKPAADPVVAEFSGEVIRCSRLDSELRKLFGRETLQNMITDRLIDKAVAQHNCSVTENELNEWVADYKKRPDAQELVASNQLDIDKLKANLRRSVPLYKLVLGNVSEAERKKYFNQRASSFEEMELRGILLGSESEANELSVRINGEDAFAAMALVHSLDIQTRDIGGSLGRVTRAELEESFDPLSVKELFAQKVGTLSAPMASNSGGWYLFWIKSRTTDYDHLRLRVIEVMAAERLQPFLEQLCTQAGVKILLPESDVSAAQNRKTESKPDKGGVEIKPTSSGSETVQPRSQEEKK